MDRRECGRRCCGETCDLGMCKQCTCHSRITHAFSRGRLAQGSRSSTDALNLCVLRPHLHSRHVVTFTVSTRRSTSSTTPSTSSPPTRTTWKHLRNTVDRFTILPSRVHSQVTSPTPPWRLSARRTLLRRQVSVPHIIPLRKSRRSPCSRVRFTILALDDWLHRCSSTREKQVSFSPEFITLKEKTPRHTCRTEAR